MLRGDPGALVWRFLGQRLRHRSLHRLRLGKRRRQDIVFSLTSLNEDDMYDDLLMADCTSVLMLGILCLLMMTTNVMTCVSKMSMMTLARNARTSRGMNRTQG